MNTVRPEWSLSIVEGEIEGIAMLHFDANFVELSPCSVRTEES